MRTLVSVLAVMACFTIAPAAQAKSDPGVVNEGVVRALAQACGGAQLLMRVTESSSHFNGIASEMDPVVAETAIRQVQHELSTELVGPGLPALCKEATPRLSVMVEARRSISELRATIQKAKGADTNKLRAEILNELQREQGAVMAVLGAALKFIESPDRVACKPRVVRCDIDRPDGSKDWVYPNAQGRCEPDHRGGTVQAILGVPGDLAGAQQRCR